MPSLVEDYVGAPLADWSKAWGQVRRDANAEDCCFFFPPIQPVAGASAWGGLFGPLVCLINALIFSIVYALLPLWLLIALVATLVELCAEKPDLSAISQNVFALVVGVFLSISIYLYLIVAIPIAHCSGRPPDKETRFRSGSRDVFGGDLKALPIEDKDLPPRFAGKVEACKKFYKKIICGIDASRATWSHICYALRALGAQLVGGTSDAEWVQQRKTFFTELLGVPVTDTCTAAIRCERDTHGEYEAQADLHFTLTLEGQAKPIEFDLTLQRASRQDLVSPDRRTVFLEMLRHIAAQLPPQTGAPS